MTEPTLLPFDDPKAPKYWMHETGGRLAPAMERYLRREPARWDDVLLIRAYLRQWIDSPVWDHPDGDAEVRAAVDELRRNVRGLRNRGDIDKWVADALDLAIDPL